MPPRRPTQDRTGTITPHPRDDHTYADLTSTVTSARSIMALGQFC